MTVIRRHREPRPNIFQLIGAWLWGMLSFRPFWPTDLRNELVEIFNLRDPPFTIRMKMYILKRDIEHLLANAFGFLKNLTRFLIVCPKLMMWLLGVLSFWLFWPTDPRNELIGIFSVHKIASTVRVKIFSLKQDIEYQITNVLSSLKISPGDLKVNAKLMKKWLLSFIPVRPFRLMDLPDELIVEIISHLLPPDRPCLSRPFYYWNALYSPRSINEESAQCVKSLISLSLSSRRLYHLGTPFLYRNILILHTRQLYRRRQIHNALVDFTRAVENNPHLLDHIKTITACCGDSIHRLRDFFWYKNIHTITIDGFWDWEAPEPGNYQLRTSPVKNLSLIECGAQEEPLAAVLSWPEKLERLHYDFASREEEEWPGHILLRSLRPHKGTLKELTLTTRWDYDEISYPELGVDLSDFTTLTTLRTFYAFLCGDGDSRDAWQRLPNSLELLDIQDDSPRFGTFLKKCENDESISGEWLVELIGHKEIHLPKLSKLSIWAEGKDWVNPSLRPWMPPASLLQKCQSLSLEMNIWLGSTDYPESEGSDDGTL